MPRAKNGSSTKIGVVWQKSDFWAKNFFGGGSDGKVVAPGIVVICSINKNWGRMAKIGFFGQKLKFWAQKKGDTFVL